MSLHLRGRGTTKWWKESCSHPHQRTDKSKFAEMLGSESRAPTTFDFVEVGANCVSTAQVGAVVKPRPPHEERFGKRVFFCAGDH